MAEIAGQTSLQGERAAAYSSNWEQLSDELRCLDLCLRRNLAGQQQHPVSDPLAPFKGLVVTDAEVAELLSCPSDSSDEMNSEQESLTRELGELQAEIKERCAASLAAKTYLALPHL